MRNLHKIKTRALPLGGLEEAIAHPIVLQLQGGPVFSGNIYFNNSAYSLSTIII